MCPKHGIDFLEYKCKFCCSIAVFFCFGTTHFCDTCHDDFQRLTNIPKIKLPKCPAGPKASQLMGDECPLHIVHPPSEFSDSFGCYSNPNFVNSLQLERSLRWAVESAGTSTHSKFSEILKMLEKIGELICFVLFILIFLFLFKPYCNIVSSQDVCLLCNFQGKM